MAWGLGLGLRRGLMIGLGPDVGLVFKCFSSSKLELNIPSRKKTRPDTRPPKSRAGGQGPYMMSLEHLGRSSEV